MKLFRCTILVSGCAASAAAFAGSGQLNVHASAGLFAPANVSNYTEQSMNFSGLGAVGPISTTASVSAGSESIYVFQNISADITSETSGSFNTNEGWSNVVGPDQGFANVSPTTTSLYPWYSSYNFTTATSGLFDVTYNASATSNDGLGGFGLWN